MDQNQYGEQGGKAHSTNQYQCNNHMNMMGPTHLPTQIGGPFALYPYMTEQQYGHQYMHQLQQQQQQGPGGLLEQQLNNFWATNYQEIEETTDFRFHSLPLARIKKIMKTDEDVKMISAEAPVVFAKACEMFIIELTMKAWVNANENKRRTLQKSDIADAISKTEVFDFLVDVVPKDEPTTDHDLFVPIGNVPPNYVPSPNFVTLAPPYGAPVMVMGRPIFPPLATRMLPIPKQENDHASS
ncbi:nuclear transcription factor Y subunit C-2-like [Gastrolobium bilobum]|uniref:nuclear transcription factor Y subunit C-2-like n=1 Tax=Gastrolobium bilobum TaxID=150636 RepID=UPI002AB136F0|nr:nuclear transcription factor Y subunit C-2-like [Gastrolobium bilobum]